jgi:hypothetical protein
MYFLIPVRAGPKDCKAGVGDTYNYRDRRTSVKFCQNQQHLSELDAGRVFLFFR